MTDDRDYYKNNEISLSAAEEMEDTYYIIKRKIAKLLASYLPVYTLNFCITQEDIEYDLYPHRGFTDDGKIKLKEYLMVLYNKFVEIHDRRKGKQRKYKLKDEEFRAYIQKYDIHRPPVGGSWLKVSAKNYKKYLKGEYRKWQYV